MFKIVAFAAALSFAAISPALAQSASPLMNVAGAPAATQIQVPVKTSDRTPGNPAPDRTPGASITGAAGTEVARTAFGTSDRTPSNHYVPPSH